MEIGITLGKVFEALGIPIFLRAYGGFITVFVCAVLILTPWFKTMPYRIWVALTSVLCPVAVFMIAFIFGLFGSISGRSFETLAPLSPILLVFPPIALSFYQTIKTIVGLKKITFLLVLFVLLLVQLYHTVLCWVATNPNFMGAGC